MQYSIPLASNTGAEAVRERVEKRRALFDGHAGLVHKSFLYSEKDHLYAPLYLWKDVAEARNFLLDDLFQGVVESFSRHRVRSWLVLAKACGQKCVPAFARREIDPLPSEEALPTLRAREEMLQKKLLVAHPGLYMHVAALDADRWETVRFSLWKDAASAPPTRSDCVQEYTVLHVSEPVCNG